MYIFYIYICILFLYIRAGAFNPIKKAARVVFIKDYYNSLYAAGLKDFIYKLLAIKVIAYIKESLKALRAEVYSNYY